MPSVMMRSACRRATAVWASYARNLAALTRRLLERIRNFTEFWRRSGMTVRVSS